MEHRNHDRQSWLDDPKGWETQTPHSYPIAVEHRVSLQVNINNRQLPLQVQLHVLPCPAIQSYNSAQSATKRTLNIAHDAIAPHTALRHVSKTTGRLTSYFVPHFPPLLLQTDRLRTIIVQYYSIPTRRNRNSLGFLASGFGTTMENAITGRPISTQYLVTILSQRTYLFSTARD